MKKKRRHQLRKTYITLDSYTIFMLPFRIQKVYCNLCFIQHNNKNVMSASTIFFFASKNIFTVINIFAFVLYNFQAMINLIPLSMLNPYIMHLCNSFALFTFEYNKTCVKACFFSMKIAKQLGLITPYKADHFEKAFFVLTFFKVRSVVFVRGKWNFYFM